jgi:3-oxoacyl-[acyl-carrier protein] reductase
MDLGLSGKKALVTGASKGIGRAIVEALHGEGAEIIASAREAAGLKKLVDSVKGKAKLITKPCDLADSGSRAELIEFVEAEFGNVDIIIHNVGGPKPSDVMNTTGSDWHAGFDQLFASVAHLNEALVPSMKEKRFGRIICVTSLSVLEPIAGLAVSNAIRSAVTAMLKTLADELAPYSITVNCVAPGAIATDRLNELMTVRLAKSGQSKEEYLKEYLKAIPAGRLGEPHEFASVVAFLASTRASYVTGSTVAVDGGKRRSTY